MLDCLICRSDYNYTENLPKILPDCGHTVCSACLTIILKSGKCPECRKEFSRNTPRDVKQFQTNIVLQRILETMTDVCKEHQSPLTQMCLTDKVKICINCVKEGSHQNHVIETLEKTRAKASKKVQDYKKTETEIENLTKQNNDFLVKLQDDTLKAIQDTSSLQEHLETAKRQYLWDLEFLLLKKSSLDQSKMAEINAYDEKMSSLKKILEDDEINKEFFGALEAPIEHPIADENQNTEFQAFAEELGNKFTSATCQLENYGTSVIQKSFGGGIEFTNFLPAENKAVELSACLEILKDECFDFYIYKKTILVIFPKATSSGSSIIEENLENIQTLSILPSHLNWTDEMVDGLHYLSKNFASAISIRLDFDSKNFTDKDLLSCLNYPFWKKGSVADLSINLAGCKLDSEAALLEFIEYVVQQASDLTGLSFEFDSTNLTDLFFEPFVQKVIPLAENLQSLSFSLSDTKVTDAGIKDLFTWNFQGLDKILKLKDISLNISKTSIGVLGMDTILQGMKKIENLKKLSMDVSNLSFGAGSSTDIEKYLKSVAKLEILSFNFSKVNFSSQSFNPICSSLPIYLSQLTLNFSETLIVDENVRKLASASLAKMKNLEVLELNFRFTGIGDDSLLALSEVFLKSKTIKTLVLNFYNTQISEELLSYLLTDVISQMTTLSKFQISVNQNRLQSETSDLIDQINKKYE